MGDKSNSTNHPGLSAVVFLGTVALVGLPWIVHGFIFPYTGLMVRESNFTGRSVFPEDLGQSLNVLQWSLVAIGFGHLTRRIPKVALVPLAFGCVVGVMVVSELIFRFGFDVDQSVAMTIAKVRPEPTATACVYVAAAILDLGFVARIVFSNQGGKMPTQSPDPAP